MCVTEINTRHAIYNAPFYSLDNGRPLGVGVMNKFIILFGGFEDSLYIDTHEPTVQYVAPMYPLKYEFI